MSIRSKLLVVFFIFGIAPMLLLGVANYLRGTRTVERLVREDVEDGATRIAREIEETLHARDSGVMDLARSRALREYVREARSRHERGAPSAQTVQRSRPGSGEEADLPDDVRAVLSTFFVSHRDYYAALTCLDAGGRPLFRIDGVTAEEGPAARIQTEDFVMSGVRPDARVWTVTKLSALRSPVTREPFGASLRTTVPVFTEDGEAGPRGALIAELKLDALFREAEGGQTVRGLRGEVAAPPTRLVVALDRTGHIIYHTSDALKYQLVTSVMPFFKPVADRMMAGASDWSRYEAADDKRWLAAYRPVAGTDLSVAVAANYSDAVAGLERTSLISLVLAVLATLLATELLLLVVRRTARRIERVATGAAAVAGGDLNQHIQVRTSDETHLLAESFNLMTDRLREHIARESEMRQFESFMRLSAILTHDLKNAITGLSMLVSNMERQFHREEFRADAIWSLREATDKLRRIVARLSEPVKSLSGEYRRGSKAVDLVPVIKRVLAATAETYAPLYQVETRLPASLVATVEAERMENVIENLVINALEAMGAAGGRLTVEAGEDESGRVFFSVSDTGVGMSEEFLRSRLFRPFATTKEKGIGLGLYTCREIVEAHGGRLEVDSRLGVGTRFRVVLPSNPFTSRERREQPPKKVATGERRSV